MLAILFGLSMDYEVFLLSRIREQYDLTGDNTAAVAAGRAAHRRASSPAPRCCSSSSSARSRPRGSCSSRCSASAWSIAIALDATVVRALLVPATMRLLGRANWWAPGPLARVYRRYGIREGDSPAPRPAEPAHAG